MPLDTQSPIFQEFLIESNEALSTISEEFTHYEKNPGDKELLNSIYRKVHTLKGSASFLGLTKLQEITHVAENVLDAIREGAVQVNEEAIDIFLKCFDTCTEILKLLESSGIEGDKDYSKLKFSLQSLLSKKEPIGEVEIVDNDTPPNVVAMKSKNEMPKKVVEKEPEELPVHQPVEEVLSRAVRPADDSQDDLHGNQKKSAAVVDSVVRVNVKLLDKIMNVVGELVLNRNQILQLASSQDWPEMNRLVQSLNVITTELQTDIMTTRMQPVGSVLSKFERIVRDLSRSQGKKIKLTISGKETELDKTLLEAIRDPMTHLIRNSIDHGIELPVDRKKRGKSEEGHIQISSYHESGQVTIEIRDDGNGIDPEKVLRKAIEKGIVPESSAESMNTKRIISLIFSPGFSTAEKVTNISGRGVGMDVVKSNIEKIGGSVDVNSVVGKGSTFKLKIPLTLAIVPALIVKASGENFSIPQINLVELVRFDLEDNSDAIEKLHDSEFYRLRGELIPIFRLSESLGLSCKMEKSTETNIVILNAEGRVYGLVVDEILDTEEIVVKPLSKTLKEITIFGGATLMGDGNVALIIDALGFINSVEKSHSSRGDMLIEQSKYEPSYIDRNEILLVKLSDGGTYGVPLILVNRLEDFDRKELEWTGNRPIIRYRGRAMPLVDLSKSVGLSPSPGLKKEGNLQGDLSCIVVDMRGVQVGLIVESIFDIAVTEGKIESESVDRAEVFGTSFIDEKIVTIIDPYTVVDNAGLHLKKYVKENGKNGLILLVEDSNLFQKFQTEALSSEGFSVKCVNSPAEALSLLKNESSFGAIVTDIDLPGMNGFQFMKKFRDDFPKLKNIPVIGASTDMAAKRDVDENCKIFSFTIDKQKTDDLVNTVKLAVGGK